MLLNILFVIALTFPVAVTSTAFGLMNKEQCTMNNEQCSVGKGRLIARALMLALILGLGQGVMYSLGSLLGGTFMHLLMSFSKWIILALCFSVSFRMLIDTLKIKNGENLYFIQNKKYLLLLSVALGINAFIVGLMSDLLPLFQNMTPYILIATGFIWSLVSMMIPFSKTKLTLNSLLNAIFAAIILVRALLELI